MKHFNTLIGALLGFALATVLYAVVLYYHMPSEGPIMDLPKEYKAMANDTLIGSYDSTSNNLHISWATHYSQ